MKKANGIIILLFILFASCQQQAENIVIENGNLRLEINDQSKIKITLLNENTIALMDDFQSSEYLLAENFKTDAFTLTSIIEQSTESDLGVKNEWVISGNFSLENNINVKKTTWISAYEAFPDMVTIRSEYENAGDDFVVQKLVSNHFQLNNTDADPPFWAFQGSSTSARKDWIRPVTNGYYDRNYMGMNNSDYGGGIPAVDVWRPDGGLAIGHVEKVPTLLSLPTQMKHGQKNASVSIEKNFDYPTLFESGEKMESSENFIIVHTGDYYSSLALYSEFMQSNGITMAPSEEAAYESIWCAWGYEREFTLDEVIGTLPKVKELGIKWAVLDDGFQIAEGDWHANPKKFKNGDKDIKNLVKSIHDAGLKAKVWWTPLAADPTSQALQENPEMQLFTDEWAPQFITWWDAYYLAPKNEKTMEHTKEILDLFMKEWDFDGLKMDGQHMNAVPPDHNPASQLEYAEQAVEGLPDFFKMIYDEARAIKPNAVIENCPCGTCMSFFNMPHMNQAVSSDPLSSWQIRHKGKTYKALIPNTAYYGDHVELSDNASDFASSFGIGAVLGTKFTWPKDNPKASDSFLLTPEKEIAWKKWFGLYNELMLSKEEYLGDLYDIGYDKPETHVIKKGEDFYYAFYADDWSGEIDLRGLSNQEYTVQDYFNNKALGQVSGTSSSMDTSFKDFLLIKVSPK